MVVFFMPIFLTKFTKSTAKNYKPIVRVYVSLLFISYQLVMQQFNTKKEVKL